MRIVVAGLRKLVRRLATWLSLGILVGLLVLVFVSVGATARQGAGRNAQAGLTLLTFPGTYHQVLAFILGLGGLLAVIYGAAVAGSEWGWGTLKAAVARGESRSGYVLGSFAAIALLIVVGLLVAFAAGVGGAIIGAGLANVPTTGIGDATALRQLPDELARGWIAIVAIGAIGFALATLARSQLAGIAGGVALYFGEQFAGIFVPQVVKFLPFNAATAVIAAPPSVEPGGGGRIVQTLEPNIALLVIVGWLVASLAIAAVATERAEIGG